MSEGAPPKEKRLSMHLFSYVILHKFGEHNALYLVCDIDKIDVRENVEGIRDVVGGIADGVGGTICDAYQTPKTEEDLL